MKILQRRVFWLSNCNQFANGNWLLKFWLFFDYSEISCTCKIFHSIMFVWTFDQDNLVLNWLLKIHDCSKFHHCLLRWFEKKYFSFIIQSRHFIVVRFHQKRIHCKEMVWELWIRKISTIFKKHSIFFNISKTQLNTPYDQPIFQSISLKEWYYVSMMMGVGCWPHIWINIMILLLLLLGWLL